MSSGTNDTREEIERRLEQATPGRWESIKAMVRTEFMDGHSEYLYDVISCDSNHPTESVHLVDKRIAQVLESDADFIAHAPEDIRSLLQENQKYEEALKRARDHLRFHYWKDDPNSNKRFEAVQEVEAALQQSEESSGKRKMSDDEAAAFYEDPQNRVPVGPPVARKKAKGKERTE